MSGMGVTWRVFDASGTILRSGTAANDADAFRDAGSLRNGDRLQISSTQRPIVHRPVDRVLGRDPRQAFTTSRRRDRKPE